MTSPVTRKRIIKSDNLEDVEMCFWTGSPWENEDLPKPLKSDVYLQNREDLYVYAWRFGGWALSYAEWENEHEKLKEALGDKATIPDVWYTVGYNSPWKETNRRNEVWLPVNKEDIDLMYLNNNEAN